MNERDTIAILANPLGNRKKINQFFDVIEAKLNSKGISYLYFKENWPTDINSFRECWIIGGDGTINYFLNFYKEIHIPLVLFKGGSGNDFATMLYGKMNVSEQVDHVLTAESKSIDAAQCNDKIFINGIGIGFDGEVLRSIKTVRFFGGHAGYLMAVIKQIFIYRERLLHIQSGSLDISEKFLLTMSCNTSTMGGGFKISPLSKLNDGLLNVVLAKPLSLFKRLRYLPVIEKGKHLHLDFIRHFTAAKISISCSENMLAQIDGELIEGSEFQIKVLPGKYLFKY